MFIGHPSRPKREIALYSGRWPLAALLEAAGYFVPDALLEREGLVRVKVGKRLVIMAKSKETP